VKCNQSATIREGGMVVLNSTQIAKTSSKQKEMFRQQKEMEQIAFGNDK